MTNKNTTTELKHIIEAAAALVILPIEDDELQEQMLVQVRKIVAAVKVIESGRSAAHGEPSKAGSAEQVSEREAFEAGRQAGIKETLSNAQHAAVEMGKRINEQEHQLLTGKFLDRIIRLLEKKNPDWDRIKVGAYLQAISNIELLTLIGDALGQRTPD